MGLSWCLSGKRRNRGTGVRGYGFSLPRHAPAQVSAANLTWDGVATYTMACWHDGLVLPRNDYVRAQWAAGALNVKEVGALRPPESALRVP